MELVIVESPFAGGENIRFEEYTLGRLEMLDGFVGDKKFEFPHNSKTYAKRQIAIKYARAAMRDCLLRGEAPYASHLLYTQDGVLDDDTPDERGLGIEAGLCWGAAASKTVVYIDLGISDGMAEGIQRAKREGSPIEQRMLPGWS